MNARFPATCIICHSDIERGDEVEFHPTIRGPQGGKKVVHVHCLHGSNSALENPFFVTPRGTAMGLEEAEFQMHRSRGTLPPALRREVEIESFDPSALPEGYSVREVNEDGQQKFYVFFRGQNTGKYGLTAKKAAEIVSRMEGGKVMKSPPKFTRGNPRHRRSRR